MDTAWIQVFILIFSQCAAPPGKTVCQEQEVRYQFYTRNDCEQVLTELIEYKGSAENVIVNRDKSRCLPTAKTQRVFTNLDAINNASAELDGWGELPVDEERMDFIQKAHDVRLGELFECAETGGIAPCKIGDIIVEGATVRKTEVWTRQQ